jgi:hypothetical protein
MCADHHEELKCSDDCRSCCKRDVQILSVFTKEEELAKGVIETLEEQILKFQYLHAGKWVASRAGTVAATVWKCVIFHVESSAPEKHMLVQWSSDF